MGNNYTSGAITGDLEDQFRTYLQGQTFGRGDGVGYGQLSPFARAQLRGRMAPAQTEFQLFGQGTPFGTFLEDRPEGGRTQAQINQQVQNLRSLLGTAGGLAGGGFQGAQAQALRGFFGDDEAAQKNAALLGASRGVNPYFRQALRTGAEEGFREYRAAFPGTSWLDYANQAGLLGTVAS